MKIYMVSYGSCNYDEHMSIEKFFDSKEKAENYIKIRIIENPLLKGYMSIDEYEVE